MAGATAGTLTFMVGGDEQTFEEAKVGMGVCAAVCRPASHSKYGAAIPQCHGKEHGSGGRAGSGR